MSTTTVNQQELKVVLESLTPLFPQGSKEIPVGFHFSGYQLTIVCLQSVVYQAQLELQESLTSYCTIMYNNIAPLLEKTGFVKLEVTPVSLIIHGGDFDVEFPFGYSNVEEQDIPSEGYKPITQSMYYTGFRAILNIGLDKLYKLDPPIQLNEGIAVQKFPNVWLQVRTPGLPICTTIDRTHLKLIQNFNPQAVCDEVPGVLTFMNRNAVLQIPCKAANSSSSVTDLLSDMDSEITLRLGNYYERLNVATKVSGNTPCKISIREDGITTTVMSNGVQVSLSCGANEGEFLNAVQLPLQLWMAFLKGIETNTFQILVGGDKICLRTQNLIIVTHVLR